MNASDITCQDNLNSAQGLRGNRGADGPMGPPGLYGNIGPDGETGPVGTERYDLSFSNYIKSQDFSHPYFSLNKTWNLHIAYFTYPGSSIFTPSTFSVAAGFQVGNQAEKAELSYEAEIYDFTNRKVVASFSSTPIIAGEYKGKELGAISINSNINPFSNLPSGEAIFTLRIKVNPPSEGNVTPTLNIYSFQMY